MHRKFTNAYGNCSDHWFLSCFFILYMFFSQLSWSLRTRFSWCDWIELSNPLNVCWGGRRAEEKPVKSVRNHNGCLVRAGLTCWETHVSDHIKTDRQTDAGKQTIKLYNNLTLWNLLLLSESSLQRPLPRLSCEEEVCYKKLPPSEIKRLNSCVHGHQQVKWQGLTLLRLQNPLPGQAHTGHRSTEEHTERVLFCGPMCGSAPAGRSEMIGLPRDAAQRTHCFHAAKASAGMQYGAAGNSQFTAYLYRKSSNPRKAPACRLTLWWEFSNRGGQRAGPDRHQTEPRISFLRRESRRGSLCWSARNVKPTEGLANRYLT